MLEALLGWCFAPFIVLLRCFLTPTIILFCVLGTRTNVISENFGGWSFTLFILISFFWVLTIQSSDPLLTSSYRRSLLSKSKCFSKIKVSYSFPKTLKRTSQSSVALMLTSQDLFIFSKRGRSLLNDSVAGKAPNHLPSWFSFSSLPMGI